MSSIRNEAYSGADPEFHVRQCQNCRSPQQAHKNSRIHIKAITGGLAGFLLGRMVTDSHGSIDSAPLDGTDHGTS
jgi:hypothetical protein